jgi:hypothetical protein
VVKNVGVVQGGLAKVIPYAEGGAGVNQLAHNQRVTIFRQAIAGRAHNCGSFHKGGLALRVLQVKTGASTDQLPHRLDIAPLCENDQGSLAL